MGQSSVPHQNNADKSDVLLIFPIWTAGAGRSKMQRMLPPLGILSIAANLIKHGKSVKILDLHAERLSPEEFVQAVKKINPKYVGITVLSNHFKIAHRIASICKEINASCKIIVGGTHAEVYPEQMLSNPAIDAVCRGDGEDIMLQFVSGEELKNIKGICYYSNSNVIWNDNQKINKDLDQYPFPAYEKINFKKYYPPIGTYKTLPALNMLMTRGCPGSCTFCNSAKTILRNRSPEKMLDLIEMLRDRYGIRQISFYDDTFTANKKVFYAFCKGMIDRKMNVNFVCYARADMFNEEMAELASKAGCHHILMGIESGSESLMRDIGKKIEKEKYRNAVAIAHKNGMEVRGSFILGHLNETIETMNETLKFAKEIDLDYYQPNILTPYPGTQLFKKAKEENLLIHENYELYGQGKVILKMKHLSAEQVEEFLLKSTISFYLQPKIIWRQIKRLRNLHQLMDLIKSGYIMFFGFLGDRNRNIEKEWENFEISDLLTRETINKSEPRMTWEVMQ